MIRVEPPGDGTAVPAGCRYALDLLLDLSRLPRVDDASAEIVRLSPDAAHDGVRTAGDLAQWHPRLEDGQLRIGIDTLNTIADVAAARAEQETEAADRHGRVPSNINALVADHCERRPVLDLAASRLAEAARYVSDRRHFRLLPAWPDGASWAAALTHDLDVVSWWPLFAVLRWLELARGAQLGMLSRAIASSMRSAFRSPVLEATRSLLEMEAECDIRSTWFVLSGTPTFSTFRRGDLTYRLESYRARDILTSVIAQRHEIALHGSFASFADAEVFRDQRARAALVTGRSIDGVRQHFLRMRAPTTQRAMAAAGFSYDASFGFPDRNGFRLGAASPIPAWDARTAEPIAIDLVPLVWMDRAMSKYSGIQEPTRWVDDALALAESARAVNGMWVGLWHPNLHDALGYPGAPEQYARLIRELRAMRPLIATVEELVAWRKRRRAFRVRHAAADGTIESNDPALQRELQSPSSP